MCNSLYHDDTCFMIDFVDLYVSGRVQEFVQEDTLLIALQQDDHEKVDSEVVHAMVGELDETEVENKDAKKEDIEGIPHPSLKSHLKNL